MPRDEWARANNRTRYGRVQPWYSKPSKKRKRRKRTDVNGKRIPTWRNTPDIHNLTDEELLATGKRVAEYGQGSKYLFLLREEWRRRQRMKRLGLNPTGILHLGAPYARRHPVPKDVVLNPSEECPFEV